MRRNLLMMGALALLTFPSFADHHGGKKEKRPALSIQGGGPSNLSSESRRKITNKRAASLVKQRYSSSRILGISLLEEGGPPIYRVRTLSPNGVVKSVFVDGQSGEVFE